MVRVKWFSKGDPAPKWSSWRMSRHRSEREEEGLGSQWGELHPLSPGYQGSGVSGESEIGALGNAFVILVIVLADSDWRFDWDVDWDGWARTALVE